VANRTYNDRCGIARALDAVGDRWALLVVRELLIGPKRFTDLRAGLPRVSPDVLAQRLRELEAAGVLRRDSLPPPAASQVYELTERGRELRTVILELGRWGSGEPANDGPLGPDAAVIALMTMFRCDLEGIFELRLDGHVFSLSAADGTLDAVRGPAAQPTAVIEGTPGTLASVLWHGADARQLTVTGDARRFLRAFTPPARREGSAPARRGTRA
jgi:DNA-binding HxlR family transcriptional regulator